MKLHVAGDIRVPGDKSITHRALMLAACAEGESRLAGLLAGEDCQSTAAVLRALGCDVPAPPADGTEVRIRSRGLAGWSEPVGPLDCGNSGTTARLLMGLLASRAFSCTLTGDASLRGRPMRRVTEPLTAMGARFEELEVADRLPIRIRGGALRSFAYRSAKASAQVKSAVLLAGAAAGVDVSVTEPILSRDHTERMLRAQGLDVRCRSADDGFTAEVAAGAALRPLELRVPGDPSSAAFFAALGWLADGGELCIRQVCANPTRTGFFDIARRMGADLAWIDSREEGGEPVADLVVRPSTLRGVEVGGAEIPAGIDEMPLLAVLAARAEGETRINGAAELRVKESDRIAVTVANLRAVGVEADEMEDGMVVQGGTHPLTGSVQAHGDHRIAMAFAVLGALPGNRIRVDTPEVAAVSFPGFAELLTRVSVPITR